MKEIGVQYLFVHSVLRRFLWTSCIPGDSTGVYVPNSSLHPLTFCAFFFRRHALAVGFICFVSKTDVVEIDPGKRYLLFIGETSCPKLFGGLCRDLWRRQCNPLQYSCLENPMGGGGAWQAAVHGVAKSRTRLSNFTFTFHVHALEKEMATHSSVLAWRIPGMAEPGGLPSMGSHRVRHD